MCNIFSNFSNAVLLGWATIEKATPANNAHRCSVSRMYFLCVPSTHRRLVPSHKKHAYSRSLCDRAALSWTWPVTAVGEIENVGKMAIIPLPGRGSLPCSRCKWVTWPRHYREVRDQGRDQHRVVGPCVSHTRREKGHVLNINPVNHKQYNQVRDF